jgi:hypothetical protein
MHRPGNNDELIKKSRMLRNNGILPQYDFILGNSFDTDESLSETLGLLLEFGTPINLNTYKMTYFPHYPFTNMAIEAGHITHEDVSDEKVAESVLYNFVYRPKFPALKRRDYLENCIYLIPWNHKIIRAMLHRLQKNHNPVLGVIVTILAKIRYWQSFQQVSAIIWIRRIYLGLKLILNGQWSTLFEKIKLVVRKTLYRQTNTGRLSAR